jgi:uncharacterized protein YqeY
MDHRMTLYEQVREDMKSAMKAGEKERLETLRFILASLNSAQKEKGLKEPGASLSDAETILVLQKEAKRRKESIELFKQGKRDDLVKKEETGLAFIQAYLPEELSRDAVTKIVDETMAQGFTDFSALMRETMKAVKGRADGRLVGEVIKGKLAK